MYESFLKVFWVVCVFLSGKTNQALAEKENFQRFEAGYNDINS